MASETSNPTVPPVPPASTPGGASAPDQRASVDARTNARAKNAPAAPLPPWKVLLHNDDINDARYVVRTLMKLVHMNFPNATDVMITAHTRGVATVTLTHKERAELYRDQFRSQGLTATIELAEAPGRSE